MELPLRPELIGIWTQLDRPTTEPVAAKSFKSACHAAARAVGGRLTEFRSPQVTPNFHIAHIAENGAMTAVLGHLAEPFVAFARPIDAIAMSAEFLDHEGLATAFRDYSAFTPLDVELLNRPLTEEEIAGLRPQIVKELRYWRADTLGKAMFNWFD